jgi:hypothetical protein
MMPPSPGFRNFRPGFCLRLGTRLSWPSIQVGTGGREIPLAAEPAECEMVSRFVLVGVAAIAIACGGRSPAAPSVTASPAVSTPASTLTTFGGRLTATNGGQPLGGIAVDLGGLPTTTDPSGAYNYRFGRPGSTTVLAFTGPAIVSRSLAVSLTESRTFDADAIQLSPAFDLNFYRQLVRNTFDDPARMQPLRRWMKTPAIYLKTVDEAGDPIHGPTLDLIESTILDAVPRWTSGALGVPMIERGTGSKEGVSGWITVKFPAGNTALDGYCGKAQIAVDGGWIELGYHVPDSPAGGCRTSYAVIAPHVIRHEIGHALGFYHTDTAGDLMYSSSWVSQTGLPTERELYHAAIAYKRPMGNRDPDSDPLGLVNLAPLSVR